MLRFSQQIWCTHQSAKRLVKEFTEHFGGMDVLINNAGGLGGRANLESIDDEFYERVMDLNVRSALMTTKFSIPHLRALLHSRGKTSCVISTGSIAAREGGGVGAATSRSQKEHNDIHRNWGERVCERQYPFQHCFSWQWSTLCISRW